MLGFIWVGQARTLANSSMLGSTQLHTRHHELDSGPTVLLGLGLVLSKNFIEFGHAWLDMTSHGSSWVGLRSSTSATIDNSNDIIA